MQRPNGDGRTPTVSQICGDTLVELVYDVEQKKTALVVSRFGGLWNIEQEYSTGTGEILVPYSATNNLIAHECVLLPSTPEEYGFKHELLAEIQSFLHRYVDLSESFERLASYYILLSWVHDAFNELPYLRLRGDFGTGKTRGLIAIGSLCYKPFFASAASTTSPIFHTLDAFRGTLVLDEADFPNSDAKADLTKLLNNGTIKGMPVLRTLMTKSREFNPYAFTVFGPKLVAMREGFQDKALESRFITEETGTKPLRPDIPIGLPNSLKAEALTLRNKLLHFRLCEFFNIKSDATAIMKTAEPRLNQTALSLLSLVDDPTIRREMQEWFLAGQQSAFAERQETIEAQMLRAILRAMNDTSQTVGSIGTIADHFNMEGKLSGRAPVSSRWAGSFIRRHLRLDTYKNNGVYLISPNEKKKIDALSERYGIALIAPATQIDKQCS